MSRSIVGPSSLVLTVMGSLVIACGDASGPPEASGLPRERRNDPVAEEAPPPAASAAPAPLTPAPASLPASCADAAKTYDPERPVTNVLFVLDRSGSMHLRIPGGQTRWTATRAALFATLDKLPAMNARASVMQFPQGDAPLDSCCSITSSNEVDCSACSSFPSPTNRCTASKYSPSLPTDMNPQSVAAIKAQISASDSHFYWGTPLAAGLAAAINSQKSSTKDGIKAVVLLTDGAPSSCETTNNPGANAATYVIDAAKLGMQGTEKVRTFVLGVMDGASGAQADLLSKVALAGGTARFSGCSSTDACFYPVAATTLTTSLTSALDRIARESTDCTFAVPATAASDLAKVNVTLTRAGGPQLLLRDATHGEGWDFLEGSKELKLYGQACRVLEEEDAAKVQVVVGCKTTLL